MGHSSKKKKRSGGGRRSKGRAPSKDHTSHSGDGGEVLSEELTALCAIFQEDCKVISESPPQINIKISPYSKDTGYEASDVSAILSVRCLTGYPYKCPKLQITPEEGLSQADADKLLSLLRDQANSNAREGRVMIYNLVEAAQEFLSEVVPLEQSSDSLSSAADQVSSQARDRSSQFQKDITVSGDRTWYSMGPFVYGFVDLFSGSGESWHWGLEVEDNGGMNLSLRSNKLDNSRHGYEVQEKIMDQNVKPLVFQDTKQGPLLTPVKLDTLEEESEDESKNLSATDSSRSLSGESTVKEFFVGRDLAETDVGDIDSDPSESMTAASMIDDQLSHTVERDLILAHLLRLACTSKEQLADALPEITSELYNLGIIPESVRDLVTKPSPLFDKTFNHVFGQHMVSSKISQFWKTASDSGRQNTSSIPSSRYLNDFEELQPLGHGGFGHVVLCKNKLDGRHYAVKKIRLKDKSPPDRILREVATLSRLQHQHVVRYYQAWFEAGVAGCYGDTTWGSWTAASSNFSYKGASSADITGQENKIESTYLYIQMEYCPRTLRQMFDSYSHFDKELAWHLFRQIVEGLVHIHGQGIIHRDLTPNNIFFGARNDIKIGDFGLAKFLKLEQLDQDPDPAEAAGVSVDGTGQVGTYFYTAPEIEQGWPKIDEKADMYSLGVVFFELWHPFSTQMERHIVLSELKQKRELPSDWVKEFSEQASLLQRLMSQSPSDRPSATELLQHAFPPRMEYEMLDSILRTMHTSEDTSIYDKVVNAIFDEELSSTKDHHEHVERLRLLRNDTSSIQYTDSETEARDLVVEFTTEVFRQHCAKRLEIIPLRLLGNCPELNRNTVKLLTRSGDKIELCRELRSPFVNWVIANQKSSFKRFEISYVYRKAIGHSPPNRYLQGDFDIIGGAPALTEAEVIKAATDVVTHFFHSESCDIHLNHGDLLEAIWSWIGIKADHRQKVAEELNLPEAAVNRLQTVGLRFCGVADQALPRLRGALPADKPTRKALDELSELFSYLRIWRIDKHVFIDALMPPTEHYHRGLFFQIYLRKENNPGSLMEGSLLAVGGRYDYLLNHIWDCEYKSNPPGAVGTSLALETIISHSSLDIKPFRNDISINVLVCSRGGGGLLKERMELVAELWDESIKAEFVPTSDPSFTEQYEYANEHDIKCLVIITDTGVSQKDSVKDPSLGKTIGSAKMIDGLYYFEDDISSNKKAQGLSSFRSIPVREQIMLWHFRLGHPSFPYLKKLFPSLFKGLDCSSFYCENCFLSKSHRTTYSPKPYQTSKPFYLIHSDVWGPSRITTLSGKKWFVTFIDDHTRLCWVYIMNEKSEVEKLFKDFYMMIENQFQTKIGILHTDNGTEYFNEVLGSFLTEKGIFHQSTCVDTPQQNGIAERKNKHLLEVSRAIMFSMNVPKYLWGEAVLTATYLINRMPTRVLNYFTPLESLKKSFPETRIYSNLPLKVFGCTVFVHLPSRLRSKLDPRAEKCVFVGYAPNKKGYKCFNPTKKKMFISMDVFFLENHPYFQKTFLQGEKESEENFWEISTNIPLPKTIVSHSTPNTDLFKQENVF
ncbi:eIF-2-alpha kinase GCN2 isoform X3 [Cornus florida]|uniref:eIF-2-alpha kinase GCN2 isoform X3 n=1 Tax=Cornus florida TaxID=4283 RepID=UPI0028976E5D|nr:eIF-2-alpha kinase GCN2 isoform X3 [Cornus florida]